MNSNLRAVILLSGAVLASTAPVHSENAKQSNCPKHYEQLGAICISAISGDIVLPGDAKKTAAARNPKHSDDSALNAAH